MSVPGPASCASFVESLAASAQGGAHCLTSAPLGWGKTEALLKIRSALAARGVATIFMDLFTAASTPERLLATLAQSVRPHLRAESGEVDRLVDEGVNDRQRAPAALLRLMERVTLGDLTTAFAWLIDEATEIRSLAYFPGLSEIEKPFAAMLRASPGSILTSSYMGLAAALFPDFDPVAFPGLRADDLEPGGRRGHVTPGLSAALALTRGSASTLLPLLADMEGTGDAARSLARLLYPGAPLEITCRRHYDILLMRSRGYAVCKRAAEVVASAPGKRLTDLVPLIARTPGASRQYLRWLVEVGLLTQTNKRYDFADPILGLWASLYLGRAGHPSPEQIASAVRARIANAEATELASPTGDEAPRLIRRPDRFEEID